VDNRQQSRISRRAVLGGAVAALAGALSMDSRLFAQAMQTHMPPGVAPKPKGPIVFLDYDQEELDAAYDQAPWAPNRPEIDRRNAQKSRAALARLGEPRRLAYGPTEIEKLELYPARRSKAPIHVFIHGGAWRAGRAADVAYKSETFVDAGAHFIALDFNNVVETKGDLSVMADQVRRAVAWVYKNAASFGGDPGQLYVSGTSSGAHLAGVVLTTDWRRDFGLPADIVKGGLCCSGMYDLHPVSLSGRGSYVTFTPAIIEALSSVRHLERLVAPVVVAYGTRETPEFQRQSREFAAAVKAAGKPVTLLVGEGYNHFEIQETLGNPYGLLGRAALEQMRLSRA
jgi:arylformamidase